MHTQYFLLADADTIETAYNVCHDRQQAQLYAAELTYFELHNEVPEWSIVLEKVERVGDGCIFVQRDPDQKS